MRSLVNFVRKIVQNRYMIRSLVVRDIRARYTGSFLGVFWAFIHPLIQLVMFYFVFSVVLKARLGAEYAGTHYAIWLMCGMLPWMLFSEIVNRSPGAVLEQANLITKTVFPSEILPLAHVAAAMMNHLIMFSILTGFLVVLGDGFSLKFLWIPVFFLGVILFSLGLAWFLSAVNVFLRDIGQVLGVVLQFWFFFTPVIYPAGLIPEKFQAWLSFNPMLHPVEGYRMALLGRAEPNLWGLAVLYTWGIGAIIFGGLVFRKLKPIFADVL